MPSDPARLAAWERFQREALTALRGLPVFVTSRANALSELSEWRSAIRRLLVTALARGPVDAFAFGTRRVARPTSAATRRVAKDEGLLLASQHQLGSLLEQLLGSHEYFDPPSPEPESPWVAALLDAQEDLEQVWKGLDWATQAARVAPARP